MISVWTRASLRRSNLWSKDHTKVMLKTTETWTVLTTTINMMPLIDMIRVILQNPLTKLISWVLDTTRSAMLPISSTVQTTTILQTTMLTLELPHTLTTISSTTEKDMTMPRIWLKPRLSKRNKNKKLLKMTPMNNQRRELLSQRRKL